MAVNKIVMNTENGEKVLMDLTADTVTPDTLAEGATAHDASGNKITGRMAAGSGGLPVQADWAQTDSTAPDFIKNKPFCETHSDTLVWDGTFGVMDEGFGLFTKISDAVPTADDFTNGATLNIAGETLEITGAEIQPYFNEDGFCNFEYMFVVVPRDNYASNIDGEDTVFPNAGLYTIVELPDLTMTIPGYGGFVSIQQIDAKYIPKNPNEVQQVVVYAKLENNINRIYKDEEHTDMMGVAELYACARQGKRVVVIDGNGCYDAVAVQNSHSCIIYYQWTGIEVDTIVAYCAEYTPE